MVACEVWAIDSKSEVREMLHVNQVVEMPEVEMGIWEWDASMAAALRGRP